MRHGKETDLPQVEEQKERRGQEPPQDSTVVSCSVLSDSLWPHGLQPTRLLGPWDFPGKKNGVSCHFLLQGLFST